MNEERTKTDLVARRFVCSFFLSLSSLAVLPNESDLVDFSPLGRDLRFGDFSSRTLDWDFGEAVWSEGASRFVSTRPLSPFFPQRQADLPISLSQIIRLLLQVAGTS